MTRTTIDEPTDAQTFESGLTELLRIAAENGVPIERAWECRARDEHSWEVEIVSLLAENASD